MAGKFTKVEAMARDWHGPEGESPGWTLFELAAKRKLTRIRAERALTVWFVALGIVGASLLLLLVPQWASELRLAFYGFAVASSAFFGWRCYQFAQVVIEETRAERATRDNLVEHPEPLPIKKVA